MTCPLLRYFFIPIFSAVFLVVCSFFNAQASDKIVVFYKNDEKISCRFNVVLAITPEEQMRGLMFRKELKKTEGMLFIYNDDAVRYYWMKNTYLPLDLIFIDSNLRVVDVYKNARPMDETTIISKGFARYTLEVNAGQADRCKIKNGTRVKFSNF